MQRGFGIRIAPCRFRQDNRDYYIDHAGKAISDALTSVKHISRRVADTLYNWHDRFYPCFTDLLYDMEMHPAFDSQVVEILIRLGYFQEFGSSGKLLKLFHEFREGEFKFSKAHIPATQEKRLNILRKLESEMPESELPIHEQIRFEIAMCGAPFTTAPNLRSEYASTGSGCSLQPEDSAVQHRHRSNRRHEAQKGCVQRAAPGIRFYSEIACMGAQAVLSLCGRKGLARPRAHGAMDYAL